MLCQKCKRRAAAHIYTEKGNGFPYTIALCDECKKEYAASLLPFCEPERCSRCGATLNDLIMGRMPFCPECYNSFNDGLSAYIEKIHGASRHTGKRPKSEEGAEKINYNPKIAGKERLKAELDLAVSEERYEDAAKIRDILRSTEVKE